MTSEEADLLTDISEQIYGYREVVEDLADAKKLLEKAQAMSTAIDAIVEGDLRKAERLIERYSVSYG